MRRRINLRFVALGGKTERLKEKRESRERERETCLHDKLPHNAVRPCCVRPSAALYLLDPPFPLPSFSPTFSPASSLRVFSPFTFPPCFFSFDLPSANAARISSRPRHRLRPHLHLGLRLRLRHPGCFNLVSALFSRRVSEDAFRRH